MNTVIKGFRFHPTDEELIEFLQIKTNGRDSLVQVIDEVPDICEWEPWQLAEISSLQTGDRLWYFIYSPKYKYRNSKRISRTTGEGYWKPTGNPRKIIDPETGRVIGTKKTLVYYKGQCNDNKIKTCWVMHEYELKVNPNSIDSDEKTFNLCKLKKRVDVSSTDAGSGVVKSYAGERSNQHSMITEDVVSDLSSTVVNPIYEDSNPNDTLHLKEMSKECNGPNDNDGARKLYSTVEKDEKASSSVLTDVAVPSGFEYLVYDDLSLKDFLDEDGLSCDELLENLEAADNSNTIRDQSIINMEDIKFLESILVDYDEAYPQEENRQQSSPAENEALGLPCIGVIESDSTEKPRKRQRLLCDGHVEATEAAQVCGNIGYPR